MKYFSFALLLLFLLYGCREENILDPDDGTTKPLTPIGFKIYAAFDGQIGLEWIKNNPADSYSIYRSVEDTLHFMFLKTVQENYFIDQHLDYDLTYFYRIKAINKNGMESGFTNIVLAKPENIYKPLRPTYIKIYAQNINGNPEINLNWIQSSDTDIDFYEIYRDTIETFDNLNTPIGKSKTYFYKDTTNVFILKKYFYKLIAVDKGGLKSSSTSAVGDFVLDLPKQIFPINNQSLKNISLFKFISCSKPANYKLVIQENEVYGIVKEYYFYSDKIKEEISVDVANLNLERNKSYYWRVLTFTASETEPNSYTGFFRFTYEPE